MLHLGTVAYCSKDGVMVKALTPATNVARVRFLDLASYVG